MIKKSFQDPLLYTHTQLCPVAPFLYLLNSIIEMNRIQEEGHLTTNIRLQIVLKPDYYNVAQQDKRINALQKICQML